MTGASLEIISKIGECELIKNFECTIDHILQLKSNLHNRQSLTWCSNKNVEMLGGLEATSVIVSNELKAKLLNSSCNYILCDNPRWFFQQVLKTIFMVSEIISISKTAIIADNCTLGNNISIGEYVIVEDSCIIGDNSILEHGCIIRRQSMLGKNVRIGSHSVIGGIGFGYEKNDDGNYERIPHIGNVVIKDNVEIGANSCIDRDVIQSTIIGENVKIDNLVHIGHGVIIGSNSIVAANSSIAGSSVIGKNVWIAPSVAILNKVKIGDSAFIGQGSVVLNDVEDNKMVLGNPARTLRNNLS